MRYIGHSVPYILVRHNLKKMKYSYLTLVFLIIISGCKPSEKLLEKKDDKQDLINFLFQDYIGEKPSTSFIVIKDGKIEKCQSFGYANLENQLQNRLCNKTVYCNGNFDFNKSREIKLRF